ncbi:MAG: hypothetical protein H8E17_20545 [Deltaproteobacteria bacterium]|nr:hypothetical protein [Deltaproteobacteria bacterium]
MVKLSSLEELRDLFERVRNNSDGSRLQLIICGETGCQAGGANDIIRVAKKYIMQNQLVNTIELRITGCH